MNHKTNSYQPEGISLPAFWDKVTEQDKQLLCHQMKCRKFNASSVLYIARRCKHSFPQVIVSYPLSNKREPFPTIFWLTCPHLGKICGELESDHKIAEIEKIFTELPQKIDEMHKKYARYRMALLKQDDLDGINCNIRKIIEKSGVGGIDYKSAPSAAKCLHLQLATLIGMGEHPAEKWICENVISFDCLNKKCADFEIIKD